MSASLKAEECARSWRRKAKLQPERRNQRADDDRHCIDDHLVVINFRSTCSQRQNCFYQTGNISRQWRGGGVGILYPFVGLFFRTFSWKTTQPGSPNLTHKCSTTSPGNPFILGSKGQRTRSLVIKQCRSGSLHSCECWLLLVVFCILLSVHRRSYWGMKDTHSPQNVV